MAEWVMDSLTGNMMNRGSSPAEHVVKGDVDTLVRETGQNSKDQIRGKGPVRLRYTLIELSGSRKARNSSRRWDGPSFQAGLATNCR